MTAANDIVKARIDHEVKVKAAEALRAMGLSVSDAIRLMMVRIAEEKTLPFVIGTPNKTTATAIDELEQGKGKAFNDVNKLMTDLDADA